MNKVHNDGRNLLHKFLPFFFNAHETLVQVKMHRYSVALIVLFSVVAHSAATAQNPDKYYTRRVQEGGDVFFVYPNEDFRNTDDRSAFAFDITMREGADTATINFTYYSENPLPASKLGIKTTEMNIESDVTKLYVDPLKKNWEHRYTVSIPAGQLIRVFTEPLPPRFVIETKSGKLVYEAKNRKWEKYAGVINKIFYMVYPTKFD